MRRPRPWLRSEGARAASVAVSGVSLVLLGVSGCARQEAPTGGPVDVRPPVVVTTEPSPFATVTDVGDGVRFHFDERISERVSGGTLESAVTVSPRVGEVTVKHSRRSLTVEMEGGFVPGVVYRVTLHDAISDLFGNRMTDPFELVFSTGPEPVATTLAGEVWDRVTGSAVGDAVVLAEGDDGLLHEARTDNAGIFAFRYIAPGNLVVSAFEDRNRDAVLDTAETQGSILTALTGGDTLLVDVAILAPDTSAAVLAEAEVLDSVTVVIAFDDFLDPDLDASELTPELRGPEGETPITETHQEAGYASWVGSVSDSLARLDSIDAANRPAPAPPTIPTELPDEATVDTAAAALLEPPPTVDTIPAGVDEAADPDGAAALAEPVATLDQEPLVTRPRPTALDRLTGERPGPMAADSSRILPGRRLVLRLSDPLSYDVEYEVEIGGVVNINGLPGGGGSATFTWESPPDTTIADSLAVPADTSGVGLAPDTARVDTLFLRRDRP